MNLSNKLTIIRLFSVPLILALLFVHDRVGAGADAASGQKVFRLILAILADLLFIAATITDYWDGKLARKHGWITNFGKLMDPVADKVLVLALFVALVEMQIFAAWLVALVLFREFFITGFRMLALQQGKVLAAEGLGKTKAGWQLATIISVLTFVCFYDAARLASAPRLQHYLNPYYPGWLWWLVQASMAVALYYTILSGWRYVRDNWQLLASSDI